MRMNALVRTHSLFAPLTPQFESDGIRSAAWNAAKAPC
jgi:hypothetical protein